MTVLLDSDIVIEILRQINSDVLERWDELAGSDSQVLCSPVTIAEVWHGARPKEFDEIAALLDSLTCVPIDAETGRQAGEYLRQYHKSHGLEIPDTLIAAAAVQNHAALWTRNRKHYPMKDLKFYEPTLVE